MAMVSCYSIPFDEGYQGLEKNEPAGIGEYILFGLVHAKRRWGRLVDGIQLYPEMSKFNIDGLKPL